MNNVDEFIMEHSDFELPDELAHHGIKGMQWGVQNGPPYPLSDEKHDNVVKKAESAVSSAGNTIKKTVKAVEDKVTKSKEAKAKEKLAAEKQKLKTEKLKASLAKVKAQRKALQEKEAAERKAEKDKKKAEKAEEKAAKQEAKNEEEKQAIIRDGDLRKALDNRQLFSDEELTQVLARYQLVTKLSDLTPADGKQQTQQQNNGGVSGKIDAATQKANEYAKKPVAERAMNIVGKADDLIKNGQKVADVATNGLKLYNSIASINNALGGKPMKQLNLNQNGNQGEQKQEKPRVTNDYDVNGKLIKSQTIKDVNGVSVTENRVYDPNKTTDTTNTGSANSTQSERDKLQSTPGIREKAMMTARENTSESSSSTTKSSGDDSWKNSGTPKSSNDYPNPPKASGTNATRSVSDLNSSWDAKTTAEIEELLKKGYSWY